MSSESNPQTRINELVAQISQLEAQGEQMEKQYEALNAYNTEMVLTIAALEEIEQSKVGTEILVPIGSNSWIRATLSEVKEVIFGLGANVSAGKDVESAKKNIQERMKEAQSALQQTGSQLEQIQTIIERFRSELQGFANTAQT